ncbi:MAG: 9-O-acetylesterase, partial [Candidatus Omnitrophica bacterium]|nr:9-O-acetylesterase [Candidatus Omnitrophota bacterium]
GKWKLSIALPESKGPHVLVVESAGETLEFQDVLIGEVWFCSGQSNMERTVAEAKNSEEILAKADRDEIRLFHVRPHLSTEPAEDLEGEWEISSPESVKTFSSIGYLFGVDLHERLERPVGLIEADWSSRGAESFMD